MRDSRTRGNSQSLIGDCRDGGKQMQNRGSRRPATRRSASRLWYLLLLVPYVAMIWVSSYNKAEPAWAGIPFFYWYQLLWIWIGSALIAIVYFATRRNDN